NFFFVFSDASAATTTRCAFPDFVSLSVMYSPLAHFPAFIARPIRDSTLSLCNLSHLLFQSVVYFLRYRLLKRTLKSFVLHRFLKTFLREAQVRSPSVLLAGRIRHELPFFGP